MHMLPGFPLVMVNRAFEALYICICIAMFTSMYISMYITMYMTIHRSTAPSRR